MRECLGLGPGHCCWDAIYWHKWTLLAGCCSASTAPCFPRSALWSPAPLCAQAQCCSVWERRCVNFRQLATPPSVPLHCCSDRLVRSFLSTGMLRMRAALAQALSANIGLLPSVQVTAQCQPAAMLSYPVAPFPFRAAASHMCLHRQAGHTQWAAIRSNQTGQTYPHKHANLPQSACRSAVGTSSPDV